MYYRDLLKHWKYFWLSAFFLSFRVKKSYQTIISDCNITTVWYKFHALVYQKSKINIKLKSTDNIDSTVNNVTNIIQSGDWSSISVINHSPSNKNSILIHNTKAYSGKCRPRALIGEPVSQLTNKNIITCLTHSKKSYPNIKLFKLKITQQISRPKI